MSLSTLSLNYVLEMSRTKRYNPQAIANLNTLSTYSNEEINDILSMDVKEFCDLYKADKVRDFVYKGDYFTPRDMYLISPLFYTYYTHKVIEIAHLMFGNNSLIDFSLSSTKIHYSGILEFNNEPDIVKQNAMFNKSYNMFQKEREKYLGNSVIKLDITNFFGSIKIDNLINKLTFHLGNHKTMQELDYLFGYCNFESLPQLHYSLASSVLSQMYLMDFDNELNDWLKKESLYLIRFVDDMFIVSLGGEFSNKRYNDLLNKLSFLLWKDELIINTSKTELLSPEKFKKSFELIEKNYNDFNSFISEKVINDRVDEIIERGYLLKLIEALCKVEMESGIDLKVYKILTDEYISIENEDTRKILNMIIYSKKWIRLSDDELLRIISNWKYLLFNPAQFTVLYVMVCRYLEKKDVISDNEIKRVLSYLYRNDFFTLRDTLVTASYIFQNSNKKTELLEKIRVVNSDYDILLLSTCD